MKNPKLLLKVGGGVVGVLAVVACVFIYLGYDGADEAEKARDKALNTLRGLYKESPFPSRENIEVAHKNQRNAEAWANELSRLLAQDAPKSERDFSGSWFKEELFRRLDTLRADAPLDDSGNPVVDAACLFDFDRYEASTPEDEHVPRLLLQLNLIDRFVRVLYAHGIHHLDAVGRVAFEDGGGEDSSSGRSSRSGSRSSRSGSRPSRAAAAAAPSVQLKVVQPAAQTEPVPFVRERIGLAFRAKEASLLAILDEIDSAWPYVAVSGFRIEKTGDDVRFPDETAVKKDESSRGAPAPAAPAPAGAAPRPARFFVSGALREQPVQVEMYLDLYCMNPPEEEPSDGSGGENEEEL